MGRILVAVLIAAGGAIALGTGSGIPGAPNVRSAPPVEAEAVEDQRSDTQIGRDVDSLLTLDPRIDGERLEVTVEDGLVTLNGKVSNIHEGKLAIEKAGQVRGVREVRDRLTVESGSRSQMAGRAATTTGIELRDKALEKAVLNELRRSPVLEPDDVVNVSAEGTAVKLTGLVTDMQKHVAITREAFEAGAETVRNSVDVQSLPAPEGQSIVYYDLAQVYSQDFFKASAPWGFHAIP